MAEPATLNIIPKIESFDYDPEFSEVLAAQFRTQNLVTSAYQRLKYSSVFGSNDQTPVTDSEIDKALADANIREYVSHFIDVTTRGDLDNKVARFKQYKADKETIERASVLSNFSAGLLAGVADLPTIIPVSAMGSAVKVGGVTLANFGRMAGAAAADTAITEAGLHASQDGVRTMKESAQNVVASAVVAPPLLYGATALGRAVMGSRLFNSMKPAEASRLSEGIASDVHAMETGEAAARAEAHTMKMADDTGAAMRGEPLKPHVEPAPTIRDNPEFASFFGESHVVKPDGTPLEVYHGSLAHIDEFDAGKLGSNTNAPSAREGFFFTSRKATAEYYSVGQFGTIEKAEKEAARARKFGESALDTARRLGNEADVAKWTQFIADNAGPNVKKVYLSLKNPLVHDFRGRVFRDESYKELIAKAKAAGHDGLILKNTFDAGETSKLDAWMSGRFKSEDIYVAFDKSQIRDSNSFEIPKASARAEAGIGDNGGSPIHTWEDATDGPHEAPPSGGEPPKSPPPPRGPDAGPASFRDDMTPSEFAFANSLGAEAATRGLMRLVGSNPLLEGMNAVDGETRALFAHLGMLPASTTSGNNLIANPVSVQALALANTEGLRNEVTRAMVDNFKLWKQTFTDFRGFEWEAFSRNVAQAMVRGNFHEVEKPIADAAIAVRKAFDKLYDQAVKAGYVRKGAWKPLSEIGDNPAIRDFDAARAGAVDAEIANDPKLAERFEQIRATPTKDGLPLLAEDAGSFVAVRNAVRHGELDVAAADASRSSGFTLSTGPDGALGDDLIRQGGWMRRVYSPSAIANLHAERHEFIRLEAMAILQARDQEALRLRRVYDEHVAAQRAKGLEPEMDPPKKTTFVGALRGQALENVVAGALRQARAKFEQIVHGTQAGRRIDENVGHGIQRGPLLERTVALSDEILLARGWIDDDVLSIAKHAMKQVAMDVEIGKRFRRPMTPEEHTMAMRNDPRAYWLDGDDPNTIPDLRLSVPKEAARRRYDALISAATDEKSRMKLANERGYLLGGKVGGRTYSGSLDDMIDLLRGTYDVDVQASTGATVASNVRKGLFSALMASNFITNIPEAGMQVLRHGYGTTLNHYVVRAKSAIEALAAPERLKALAAVHGDDPIRIGKNLEREAKAAGIAMEHELMSTVASRFELSSPMDAARRKGRVTAAMDFISNLASRAFFIEVQTQAMRKAAYGMYSDRIMRIAMDPASATKLDLQWAADIGASGEYLRRIREQITNNRGAFLDGGVWHPKTDNWTDPEIRSLFYAMGHTDVARVQIQPTALDKGQWSGHPVAQTIMQFMTYSLAAGMRVTASAIQGSIHSPQASARAMAGILTMLGLGGLVVALHNYASTWHKRYTGTLDRKDELPDFTANPGYWTTQMFDRSGIGGVVGQLASVLDHAGMNPVYSAARLMDRDRDITDPVKRYGRPQGVKSVLGPSGGAINDTIMLANDLRNMVLEGKPMTRATTKAVQRYSPLINHFLWKALTNEAREYIEDDILRMPAPRRR